MIITKKKKLIIKIKSEIEKNKIKIISNVELFK